MREGFSLKTSMLTLWQFIVKRMMPLKKKIITYYSQATYCHKENILSEIQTCPNEQPLIKTVSWK